MTPVRILLVEDNEGDIFLTKEALKGVKATIELSVLKDGKAAIDYMAMEGPYTERVQPDLLLLDLNLPKRNGFEVLQYIKQNDAIKHIPVIILSTSVADADVIRSYSNYANCYIPKPSDVVNFSEIMNVVETFWTSVVKLPVHK